MWQFVQSVYKTRSPLVDDFWIDEIKGKVALASTGTQAIVGRKGISWLFGKMLKMNEE